MSGPRRNRRASHADVVLPDVEDIEVSAPARASADDDVNAPEFLSFDRVPHTIEITEPTVIHGRPLPPQFDDSFADDPRLLPIRRIANEASRDPEGVLLGVGEGLAQGGTAGAGDEIAGVLNGTADYFRRRASGEDNVNWTDAYRAARDESRGYEHEAERRAPAMTQAVDLVASAPSLLAAPLPRGIGPLATLGRIGAGAGYMGGESFLRSEAPPAEAARDAAVDAAIGGATMAIPEMALSGAGLLRTARARGRLARLERAEARGNRAATRGPSNDLSDEMVNIEDELPTASERDVRDGSSVDELLAPIREGEVAGDTGLRMTPGEMVSDAMRIDPDVQRLRATGAVTIPQMRRISQLPGGVERASEIMHETGILPHGQIAREDAVVARAIEARNRAGEAIRAVERQMADAGIHVPVEQTVSDLRNRARALNSLASPRAREAAIYLENVAKRLEDAAVVRPGSAEFSVADSPIASGPMRDLRGRLRTSAELEDAMSSIESESIPDSMPIDRALREMRAFDEESQWQRGENGQAPPPNVIGSRAARRALRRSINAEVEREAPQLSNDYANARERYQYLSTLAPNEGVRSRLAQGHRTISLSDMIGGGTASGIGAGIGTAVGGPIGGLAGSVAGGISGVAANRFYRQIEGSLWARIYGGERAAPEVLVPAIARLREVARRTPEAFGSFGNAAMRAAMADSDQDWIHFMEQLVGLREGVQALEAATETANQSGDEETPVHELGFIYDQSSPGASPESEAGFTYDDEPQPRR